MATVILGIGVLAVLLMQSDAIRGGAASRRLTQASLVAEEVVEEMARAQFGSSAYFEDNDGDGDAGLDDVDGGADYARNMTRFNTDYEVFWNVAESSPAFGTDEIRIIVRWRGGLSPGASRMVFNFAKGHIIEE